MIQKLIIATFILCSFGASAQRSFIKTGVNYNADFTDHNADNKAGMLSYPSYEINFEHALGKHFSANVGYNYAVREYEYNLSMYPFIDFISWRWIHHYHIFIPEFRYYPKTVSEGLYVQIGFPYTYDYESTAMHSDNAMSFFAGFGLKYPICPKVGVEMNASISPSYDLLGDVDYGTSGFIKSGVRIYYVFGKSPAKESTGN